MTDVIGKAAKEALETLETVRGKVRGEAHDFEGAAIRGAENASTLELIVGLVEKAVSAKAGGATEEDRRILAAYKRFAAFERFASRQMEACAKEGRELLAWLDEQIAAASLEEGAVKP